MHPQLTGGMLDGCFHSKFLALGRNIPEVELSAVFHGPFACSYVPGSVCFIFFFFVLLFQYQAMSHIIPLKGLFMHYDVSKT